MTSRQPKPFQLHVADELLGQTRTKLENARFPDGLQNSGWNEGTPTSEIRKLRDFWLSSYDWKTEEEKINSEMPQFKMEVPVVGWGDIELHFAHIRSERSDAIPLLFIHGCKYAKMKSKLLKHFPGPGHFLEARKLVPLLTGPQDPKTPAFHVMCVAYIVFVPLIMKACLPFLDLGSHTIQKGGVSNTLRLRNHSITLCLPLVMTAMWLKGGTSVVSCHVSLGRHIRTVVARFL